MIGANTIVALEADKIECILRVRDRLAGHRSKLEWQRILDELADLSEIDVEQDGRRARLRAAPGSSLDPICRVVGITPPPVFQEMPPAP